MSSAKRGVYKTIGWCRASAAGGGGRAACRWTLTGRGVRLRADLASPEDVTLDHERPRDRAAGTSVWGATARTAQLTEAQSPETTLPVPVSWLQHIHLRHRYPSADCNTRIWNTVTVDRSLDWPPKKKTPLPVNRLGYLCLRRPLPVDRPGHFYLRRALLVNWLALLVYLIKITVECTRYVAVALSHSYFIYLF